MENLLDLAIEAHGGMERWKKVKSINAEMSITGAIWYVKSRPDVLKSVFIEAETQKERLVMLFSGEDKKTIFEPELISIRLGADDEYQHWNSPKKSFAGHALDTPWQDVHVAYFSGEAVWTYLTSPFLYTYPGFLTKEIEPWEENGEVWRRLKIIFPDNIASHTKEQVSYFGPDGLLRRHDYTVDILGGATGANYASGYQNINGIMIASDRKIFAYQGNDHDVIKDPLLVSIEMSSISFSEGE